MLPVPFSFSGRIARWPFFKGSTALALSGIVPALLVVFAYPAFREGRVAALIGLGAIVVLFGLAIAWISLALQVRRCRDMGWDPWIVFPLWFALQVSGPILARYGIGGGPLLVGAANLLLSGALFFWPSSRNDAGSALPRQAPAALATSTGAIPASRMSFGRR